MSGVEAVGLALAIIPIFQVVASHYKEGLRLAIQPDYRHRKLVEFYQDLKFETTFLGELLHLALDDDPQRTGSRARADSIIEQLSIGGNRDTLRTRLGTSEDAFLMLLEDTLQMLERIIKSRGLATSASDNQAPVNMLAKLRRLQDRINNRDRPADSFVQTITFISGDEKRERCLKRVQQNNEKLQRLLKIRCANTLIPDDRAPALISPPGDRIRTLLRTLYDAFAGRWNCSDARHQALVSLPACCSWSSSGGSPQSNRLNLMISTHYSTNNIWQESDVTIRAPVNFRFSAGPSTSVSSNVTFSTSTIPRRRDPIPNFCPIIRRSQENRARLSVEYDGVQLWHVIPTRAAATSPANTERCVTLSELFQQHGRVSLKTKRTLAVILARSLLHFGDSPWLSREWDKSDVIFLCNDTNETDLETPYITTHFHSIGVQAHLAHDIYRVHPNTSVLALGILLLELDEWAGIEKYRSSDHLTNGFADLNTNLTMATDALERSQDNLVQNYKRAIDACIRCDFAPRDGKASLKDESFRQGVQENIVRPLEMELAHGWPDFKIGKN